MSGKKVKIQYPAEKVSLSKLDRIEEAGSKRAGLFLLPKRQHPGGSAFANRKPENDREVVRLP
jgi:hypothetical protein